MFNKTSVFSIYFLAAFSLFITEALSFDTQPTEIFTQNSGQKRVLRRPTTVTPTSSENAVSESEVRAQVSGQKKVLRRPTTVTLTSSEDAVSESKGRTLSNGDGDWEVVRAQNYWPPLPALPRLTFTEVPASGDFTEVSRCALPKGFIRKAGAKSVQKVLNAEDWYSALLRFVIGEELQLMKYDLIVPREETLETVNVLVSDCKRGLDMCSEEERSLYLLTKLLETIDGKDVTTTILFIDRFLEVTRDRESEMGQRFRVAIEELRSEDDWDTFKTALQGVRERGTNPGFEIILYQLRYRWTTIRNRFREDLHYMVTPQANILESSCLSNIEERLKYFEGILDEDTHAQILGALEDLKEKLGSKKKKVTLLPLVYNSYLKKVVNEFPRKMYRLALELIKGGEAAKARVVLETISKDQDIKPKWRAAIATYLGAIYQDSYRFDEAKSCYNEALEFYEAGGPDVPPSEEMVALYKRRAILNQEQGCWGECFEDARSVAQLQMVMSLECGWLPCTGSLLPDLSPIIIAFKNEEYDHGFEKVTRLLLENGEGGPWIKSLALLWKGQAILAHKADRNSDRIYLLDAVEAFTSALQFAETVEGEQRNRIVEAILEQRRTAYKHLEGYFEQQAQKSKQQAQEDGDRIAMLEEWTS